MRYNSLFLIYLVIISTATIDAQKEDYFWFFDKDDSGIGTLINFHGDSLSTMAFQMPLNFLFSASISDHDGYLVAYSNLCSIMDSEHRLMFYGSIFSRGACKFAILPYQSLLFLPTGGNPETYRLFYLWKHPFWLFDNLEYAEIQYYPTLELYWVAKRGFSFGESKFAFTFNAVRHANGRDWWVLLPLENRNGFSLFLSGPDTLETKINTSFNGTWNGWHMHTVFSPQGDMFAGIDTSAHLYIHDFDRCFGKITGTTIIRMPSDSFKYYGVAFSQSGRFLYVTSTIHVYQLDMWAQDFEGSREVVATFDNLESPTPPGSIHIGQPMLAPDGKIYITAPLSEKHLHVIHAPDKKGTACNVEFDGIELFAPHGLYIPNFPHYRLSALEGSPCDTLVTVSTSDQATPSTDISIHPNPAHDDVTIHAGPGMKEAVRIHFYEITGRIISSRDILPGQTTIDTRSWPRGVYFWRVVQGDAVVLQTGKLVIQ